MTGRLVAIGLAGAFLTGLAVGRLLAQAEIDRLELSLGQFAILLQGFNTP
jgi:hypothetical protein